MQIQNKQRLRRLRKLRIRKVVVGTPVRPRLSVKFSNAHIYVQFIDDSARVTLAAASTRVKGGKSVLKANIDGATKLGKLAAEAALAKGIKKVVFDRNGIRYHGKVKALAEAARLGGLEF
jgi:large subunit ribosomal protein L18